MKEDTLGVFIQEVLKKQQKAAIQVQEKPFQGHLNAYALD
jgi:hypothetical protein